MFVVLIFSNSFVENGVVALLITYLIDNWEVSLVGAAIFVTAQQGLSSVLVIVLSHIADAYLGLFKVILISSILLIVALVLLWQLQNIALFTVVMVLIAIGQEGRESPLIQFLTHQFMTRESGLSEHDPEDRAEARSTTWWKVWRFFGSLAATLALRQVTGGNEAIISAIVMGVALLIFLSGFTFYDHQPTQPTPLTMLLTVVRIAISKRHLPYPTQPNAYYDDNGTNELSIFPSVWFSRWIDKAAVINENSPLIPQEQEESGKLRKVGDVKEVKLLLRMVPMWATFVVYSFIDATGSTFFYEQVSNLDNSLANNIIVPLSLFHLIKRCVSYGISSVCDLFIQESWSKKSQLLATNIRIGMGMGCGVLACFAVWFLEVRRLGKLKKLQNREGEIDMSIFLLTPQFFLLGLMDGLAVDRLHEFIYCTLGESWLHMEVYSIKLAIGLGKLVCAFWLLGFRTWYYLVLVFLGVVNLLFAYGFVSVICYKNATGDIGRSSYEDPDDNLVRTSKNDAEGIKVEENPDKNLVRPSKNDAEGIKVEENPDGNLVRPSKNDAEGSKLEEDPDNNIVRPSINDDEGIQGEEDPEKDVVRSSKNKAEGIQLEENTDGNQRGDDKESIQIQETISQALSV